MPNFYNYLLGLFLFLSSIGVKAQVFPSDAPCNAPTLPASPTAGVCNFNIFSSCCASYGAFLAQPTCGSSSVGRDAWLEVTGMTAGLPYNMLFVESGNRRTFVEIYELPAGASCVLPSSFLPVACAQANNTLNYTGATVSATFSPPHADSRYFARFQRAISFLLEQAISGDFCVVRAYPNETPCEAIFLTEQIAQNTNPTDGSTIGAADYFAQRLEGTVCGTNNDVWYQFVPTTCAVDVFLKNKNIGEYEIQAAILTTTTGNCADSLFEIMPCEGIADQSVDIKLSATNLTPGKTYWIVVDGWAPPYANAVGDFNIEVVRKNNVACPPLPTNYSPCACGDTLSCGGSFFTNSLLGTLSLQLADESATAVGCFDLRPFHVPTSSEVGTIEFCYERKTAANESQIAFESVIYPKCPYSISEDVVYDTSACGVARPMACFDKNGSSKIYKVTPGVTYRYCRRVAVGVVDTTCQLQEFQSFCAYAWRVDTAFVPLQQTICRGDSVKINGNVYKMSGIYRQSIGGGVRCDSLIELTLQVKDSLVTNLTKTICAGKSTVVGDSVYTRSGSYYNRLTAVGGCDSIVRLKLTVLDKILKIVTKNMCQGDSVKVGTKIYKAAGFYRDTLLANNGCDSIINLTINILSASIAFFKKTICEGDSVEAGGMIYKTTGIYLIYYFQGQFLTGCDSLLYLDLKVQLPKRDTLTKSICRGATFTVGDSLFSNTGTYQINLKNSINCDSIVTLKLTILDYARGDFFAKICTKDTIAVNGKKYYFSNPTGRDTIPRANLSLCDSILNVQITFFPPAVKTINPTICSNESIKINGVTYSITRPSGIEILQGAAASGCDSTIVIALNFLPTKINNVTAYICKNQVYKLGDSTYSTPGNYLYRTLAFNGCDSTINLLLLSAPAVATTNFVQICKGDSVTVGTQIYTQAGFYKDTLLTQRGCDSVVTTIIVVYMAEKYVTDTICFGQNITFGGKIYNLSGIYRDTLQNATLNGCDSIITLSLTVLSPISLLFNVLPATSCPLVCDGAISLTASGGASPYNYVWDTPVLSALCVGIYHVTVTDNKNCIALAAITINPASPTTSLLSLNLCGKDSVKVGNNTYTMAGNYVDTLQKANGCDSIIYLKLTKIEEFVTISAAINPMCFGDKNGVIIVNTSGLNAPYQFSVDGGVTYTNSNANPFIFNNLGIGTYNILVKTNGGCEFAAVGGVVILSQPPQLLLQIDSSLSKVCVGGTNGSLSANVMNGSGIFTYEWSNNQRTQAINNLAAGTYNVTATADDGCKISGQATISNYPTFTLNATPKDTLIRLGGAATIQLIISNLTAFSQLIVVPNEGVVSATSTAIILNPTRTTTYEITVIDSNGCDKKINVTVRVNEVTEIQVPSAFSPDGDGINDVFRLVVQGAEPRYTKFQIWNRFGQLIYNDNSKPEWDGTFDGFSQTPDVYAYVIEYTDASGKNQLLNGQTTLIR